VAKLIAPARHIEGHIEILSQPKHLMIGGSALFRRNEMARINNIGKMSYSQLARAELQVARLKNEKFNEERAEVRLRAIAMAKAYGFEIDDLFGRGHKGKVPVKYRDPKNPENTWTGRGLMPRWLVNATKGGKAKKDDFLV
jgi:DNA-binding protein H-NS